MEKSFSDYREIQLDVKLDDIKTVFPIQIHETRLYVPELSFVVLKIYIRWYYSHSMLLYTVGFHYFV